MCGKLKNTGKQSWEKGKIEEEKRRSFVTCYGSGCCGGVLVSSCELHDGHFTFVPSSNVNDGSFSPFSLLTFVEDPTIVCMRNTKNVYRNLNFDWINVSDVTFRWYVAVIWSRDSLSSRFRFCTVWRFLVISNQTSTPVSYVLVFRVENRWKCRKHFLLRIKHDYN